MHHEGVLKGYGSGPKYRPRPRPARPLTRNGRDHQPAGPIRGGQVDLARTDHFFVEIEASKQRGSFVDPRRASPTVGDWADDWLAAQADLFPHDPQQLRGDHHKAHTRRWGRVRLGDVTHAQVQRWLTDSRAWQRVRRTDVKVVQQMLGHKSATMTLDLTATSLATDSMLWPMPWLGEGLSAFWCVPTVYHGEVIELRRDAK